MLIKMSGIRYENLQGNIKGNWGGYSLAGEYFESVYS
jgi:hypothetical protein